MTTSTSNNAPGTALTRLHGLGLALPKVPAPRGAFKPFSRSGQLVFLSGQICEWEGEVKFSGPVGKVHDLQAGQQAAQICALNLLAALQLALDGDLDRVVCCHRVGGFVYATPGYPDVPKVINGASDLFFEVFGERGRHARTAVGVATLPARRPSRLKRSSRFVKASTCRPSARRHSDAPRNELTRSTLSMHHASRDPDGPAAMPMDGAAPLTECRFRKADDRCHTTLLEKRCKRTLSHVQLDLFG